MTYFYAGASDWIGPLIFALFVIISALTSKKKKTEEKKLPKRKREEFFDSPFAAPPEKKPITKQAEEPEVYSFDEIFEEIFEQKPAQQSSQTRTAQTQTPPVPQPIFTVPNSQPKAPSYAKHDFGTTPARSDLKQAQLDSFHANLEDIRTELGDVRVSLGDIEVEFEGMGEVRIEAEPSENLHPHGLHPIQRAILISEVLSPPVYSRKSRAALHYLTTPKA